MANHHKSGLALNVSVIVRLPRFVDRSLIAQKSWGDGVSKLVSEFKVPDCHQSGRVVTSPGLYPWATPTRNGEGPAGRLPSSIRLLQHFVLVGTGWLLSPTWMTKSYITRTFSIGSNITLDLLGEMTVRHVRALLPANLPEAGRPPPGASDGSIPINRRYSVCLPCSCVDGTRNGPIADNLREHVVYGLKSGIARIAGRVKFHHPSNWPRRWL